MAAAVDDDTGAVDALVDVAVVAVVAVAAVVVVSAAV